MRDRDKSIASAVSAGTGGPSNTADARGVFTRELWDPKVQSKYWLEAMSQAMDAWLRSGPFLEFMQHGLQAAIAAKRLQDGGSTRSRVDP